LLCIFYHDRKKAKKRKKGNREVGNRGEAGFGSVSMKLKTSLYKLFYLS
jgi:hypothetical protein